CLLCCRPRLAPRCALISKRCSSSYPISAGDEYHGRDTQQEKRADIGYRIFFESRVDQKSCRTRRRPPKELKRFRVFDNQRYDLACQGTYQPSDITDKGDDRFTPRTLATKE